MQIAPYLIYDLIEHGCLICRFKLFDGVVVLERTHARDGLGWRAFRRRFSKTRKPALDTLTKQPIGKLHLQLKYDIPDRPPCQSLCP